MGAQEGQLQLPLPTIQRPRRDTRVGHRRLFKSSAACFSMNGSRRQSAIPLNTCLWVTVPDEMRLRDEAGCTCKGPLDGLCASASAQRF